MGAQQEAVQKQRLLEYCDEQTNNQILDLDNFAGHAQQIQQEILAGVRDGEMAANTVPTIGDDDRSTHTASQPINRTRDGYGLLKSLLTATLMVEAKNIGQLSTPPQANSAAHPYDFAS